MHTITLEFILLTPSLDLQFDKYCMNDICIYVHYCIVDLTGKIYHKLCFKTKRLYFHPNF